MAGNDINTVLKLQTDLKTIEKELLDGISIFTEIMYINQKIQKSLETLRGLNEKIPDLEKMPDKN